MKTAATAAQFCPDTQPFCKIALLITALGLAGCESTLTALSSPPASAVPSPAPFQPFPAVIRAATFSREATLPVALVMIESVYPEELVKMNIRGTVVVEFIISDTGIAYAAKALGTPNELMTKAAVDAVTRGNFGQACCTGGQ